MNNTNFKATTGLMLDLETLGLGPRSVVSQVGIIVFPLDDPSTVSRVIDQYLPVQPQIEGLKRDVSFDTILWWMNQDEKARSRFIDNGGNDLEELLALVRSIHRKLTEEVARAGGVDNVEVWAKGPQLDVVNLETLFVDAGLVTPWKYSTVCDLRTLMRLADVHIGDVDATGITPHIAVEDCRFQLRCYAEAIRQLHARK